MIAKKEFIGKKVKLVYGNMTHVGTIVFETKKTIILKTNDKEKTFLKTGSVMFIDNKIINGKKILKRPEQRIKSC